MEAGGYTYGEAMILAPVTVDLRVDRGLQGGINNSGWTAEEIQEGMTRSYEVDLVGVSRFLYSSDGVAFLEDQTKSYYPYWMKQKTSLPRFLHGTDWLIHYFL